VRPKDLVVETGDAARDRSPSRLICYSISKKISVGVPSTKAIFRRFVMHSILRCVLAVLIGGYAGASLGQPSADVDACGSLENAFGPFDYRKIGAKELQMVENFHFTPGVETLQHGATGTIGQDIDYALRAIPNHPRALLAMVRLAQRENTPKPNGSRYPVVCWFDRAVRMAPDDALVRALYGSYLADRGDRSEALAQLEVASESGAEDVNVQYNLGLAYFKLKEFDLSLEHAHKAYAEGFPLPGLRNKLSAAGKWREPMPTPESKK